MTHLYLQPLIRNYEANRDPDRASQMKKYMKDQFDFYGIATPDRRAMMKAHIKEYGLPDWSQIDLISRSLWEADERECQFTLLDLMNRLKKKTRSGSPATSGISYHNKIMVGYCGWSCRVAYRGSF